MLIMLFRVLSTFLSLSCWFLIHGVAQNFQGNVTGVRELVGSIMTQQPSFGLALSLVVSSSSSGCPAVLFLRTDGQHDDQYGFSTNKCFLQEQINKVQEQNFLNNRILMISSGHENNTKCLDTPLGYQCHQTVNISAGFRTRWYVDFGCICGHDLQELDVYYSLNMSQTNDFTCSELVGGSVYTRGGEECHPYNKVNSFSEVNFLGLTRTERDILLFLSTAYYLVDNYCYKHVLQVGCQMAFPTCANSSIAHQLLPCYEMCEDWRKGCEAKNVQKGLLYCFGLPSRRAGQACMYNPVVCERLESVDNATVQYSYENGTAYDNDSNADIVAGSRAMFMCDDTHSLLGNSFRTCQYDGRWDGEQPKCLVKPDDSVHSDPHLLKKLIIPGVIVVALLVLTVSLFVRYKSDIRAHIYTLSVIRKIRRKYQRADREKRFDLFVAHSNKDSAWVHRKAFTNLQKANVPGYQLCSYHLNFEIGAPILENIAAGIAQSRGVLVVLSQDFVDSNWCQHEFAQCYERALEDPHFHLIVVLMEDMDKLKNLPQNLMKYCKHERRGNCIHHSDSLIWKKIEVVLGPRIEQNDNMRNVRIVDLNGDYDVEDSRSCCPNNVGNFIRKVLKPSCAEHT